MQKFLYAKYFLILACPTHGSFSMYQQIHSRLTISSPSESTDDAEDETLELRSVFLFLLRLFSSWEK